MRLRCNKCRKEMKAGKEHRHHLKIVCEACYMDIRMSRTRKTHWQYLRSIKTEYLVPGKTGKKS